MRPGIRGRIVISIGFAATLAVLGLGPFLRSMVMPTLVNNEGDRLLAAARVAAAAVPDDRIQRNSWAGRLQKAWPGLEVFFVPIENQAEGSGWLTAECRRQHTAPDRIIQASISGRSLNRINPSDPTKTIEGIEAGWEALVRVDAQSGGTSVLGLRVRDVRSSESPLWRLILLYGTAVMVLALTGGLILAFYLIVRPLSKTAAAAGRLLDGQAGISSMTDLARMHSAIEQCESIHREDVRRLERQDWEIRRMRNDLRGAQTTLIRAEKLASVGQLAAGIAHEIGNPIGIILGMSEVLRQGGLSAEQTRDFADSIHKATVRVDGTIRDLLTFARPARDEGAAASIRQVVESTVKLVETHKAFRKVRVAVSLPDGDVTAEIRPSQLQQVLLNLLLNAAWATASTADTGSDSAGTIKVSCSVDGRRISLSVEDSGPGIPEKDRERIFDPFFTTKPPGEGTGLGLAMSAQIVEVYDGEIEVADATGGGAVFTVKLWAAET